MIEIENCSTLNEIRKRIENFNSTELSIRNNTIYQLKDVFHFNYDKVETLQLSDNQIKKIHKSTFKNLVNLKYLDLSSNQLKIIGERLFRTNTKLEFLDLKNNRLTSVTNDDFASLNNLDCLKLSGNLLTKFENFTFPNLSKLKLSSNQLKVFRNVNCPKAFYLKLSHNKLKQFGDKKLVLGQSMDTLDLEDNKLRFIELKSLKDLKNLKKLYLGSNKLKFLPDTLFIDLVSLESLVLSRNELTRIQAKLLHSLESLKELILDENCIVEIEEKAFDGLKSLEKFVINDQKTNSAKERLKIHENFFQNCLNLKTVSFANSNLSEIGENAFSNLRELNRLYLQCNFLAKLPENFFPTDPAMIKEIDLSNNHFDYSKTLFVLRKQKDATIATKIKFLNLSNTKIANFDYYSFRGLEIEELDLSRTVTKQNRPKFPYDFSQISQLKTLDLSDNNFGPYSCEFRKKTVKQFLDPLNSNVCCNFVPNAIFSRALFDAKNSLTTLHLVRCQIKHIPDNFFDNLEHLIFLNLGENKLVHLNKCLYPLKNLEKLLLNNNELVDPIEQSLYGNIKLSELDLRENNIRELNQLLVYSIPLISYDRTCSINAENVFADF